LNQQLLEEVIGFGTIRNNTALKHIRINKTNSRGFGTIRNNTALKHQHFQRKRSKRFGTIRNNTALKHYSADNTDF
ncbi:MAG: hypothetical protein ACTHWL_00005, partial [Streptococcus thermophilus]